MRKLYIFLLTLCSIHNGNNVCAEQPANVKTVDLGLTSGTLWANMNLGASSVTELGNYFAWGETEVRSSDWFDQESCPLYKITKNDYIDDDGFTVTETTKGYIKYVKEEDASKYGYDGYFDNKNELERTDDAAYVLWGEDWKLPTEAQWRELVSECTWQSVTQNGTDGYKVIGKNNNYIFLPKGGYCYTNWIKNHIGEYACYWSSSLSYESNEAYGFTETGDIFSSVSNYRYIGRLIRAVSISSCSFKLTYQVDGAVYKTYEYKYGTTINPEPAPTKEGYTFSGWSEIPETMPAHDVTVTGSFDLEKCAIPTIRILGGELVFDCDTEGVTFKWSYNFNGGNVENDGKKAILAGTTNCHVTVYASKEGYRDSDTAETDIELSVGIQGDTNRDGRVNITDAVDVVNIILNSGDSSAPAIDMKHKEVELE